MKKAKCILFLLAIICTQSAYAQEGENITVRDLETWSALNLRYKISKKWTVDLEQQFRLNSNSAEVDALLTELNTKYDFSKSVFGGLGLRYARENDNSGAIQGFENHLRFQIDIGLQKEIERFNIEARLRFQTKNQLGITREQGDYPNNHLRLKAGIGYNFKNWKLDPEFSAEIFRHYEKEEKNGFNKFRCTIGTKYNTKSFGKFGVFYRMEKEMKVSYPKTTHIFGLKYTYTLKNKKK